MRMAYTRYNSKSCCPALGWLTSNHINTLKELMDFMCAKHKISAYNNAKLEVCAC
jgi:hypothetical protein